ncbi:hypothetical protein [Yoonia sp. 76]|uniref:hypothetical protein n=1 Tax=Yoonia sp. 76 TaxID=3081451 RepID=UPI002AFED334|nr:hypothetical protein [Yoonia sp. 76]
MNILKGGHVALGATLGICCTILVFLTVEHFGSIFTPNNSLLAAMIGALIGGGISLAGQVMEAESRYRERETDRRNKELAQLYGLFDTLHNILSYLIAVKAHCQRQLKRADEVGTKFRYLGIIPLSGHSRFPSISSDTRVTLMVCGAFDLYNAINNIDQYASNLLDHFDDLQKRRQEIVDLLSTKDILDEDEIRIVKGKEIEAQARYHVLERNFSDFLSSIGEAETTLDKCIDATLALIESFDGPKFKFVRKNSEPQQA